MKLKNFRRVAALGMAVGMTAVLAACGNTADTASSAFPMRLTRTVISRA